MNGTRFITLIRMNLRFPELILIDFKMLEKRLLIFQRINNSTDLLERFSNKEKRVSPQVKVLIGELLKHLLLQLLFKMDSMSEFLVKMLKEEPSPTDMLTSSTKMKMDITTQSTQL